MEETPGSEVLLRAADEREALAVLEEASAAIDRERVQCQKDIERLREDLRAAQGTRGARSIAAQLAGLEADLRRLNARYAEVEIERKEQADQLLTVLQALPQRTDPEE
jgi:septal ring factor EnvC (AmiA/AmiB activator)